MAAKLYNCLFETEGADLFVEIEAEEGLNRQHLLERVVAILEDRHGMETVDNDQGDMTKVDHSDGATLLAWLSISGQSSRQALDDDGLDEILTCLVFMLFPPVVETSVQDENKKALALA